MPCTRDSSVYSRKPFTVPYGGSRASSLTSGGQKEHEEDTETVISSNKFREAQDGEKATEAEAEEDFDKAPQAGAVHRNQKSKAKSKKG
ncbi:hypothetical protein ACMFMG_001379 [Clarireedia jacksonii]